MIFNNTIVWPLYALSSFIFPQDSLTSFVSSLKPQLSVGATITYPQDPRWEELQSRSSFPRVSPDYSVAVEVATEADVQATVTLANDYNIPFLAVSGTHALTRTLNGLRNGVQINLRKLNVTTLSEDGKSAFIGGGTLQYEVTSSLFEHGKYAVTGLCACVSLAGPLLGGGHSYLQGQYGYSSDNLISARIVLANGTIAEVSQSKNPELFWALQGAGHNFGIATSLQVKVYSVPSKWTVYKLIYSEDKLEEVFNLVNKFEEPSFGRPAKLALSGVAVRIPAVDPRNPVIAYTVLYEGTEMEAEPYASPFKALGPVATEVLMNIEYGDLYTVNGHGIKSPTCVRNQNLLGCGITLPAWDLSGLRKAFTIYANATADPRFSNGIILFENYGMQGVRQANSEIAALPLEEREYPILSNPVLWWEGADEQTTKDALVYVRAMRDAMYTDYDLSRKKRHSYVNYANGEETLAEMYGYDFRLEKLTKLKQEWDPENKFGYYAPIA